MLLHPNGKREPASGTSFATPAVASLVAQMFLLKPDLTTGQIRKIIDESTQGYVDSVFNKELEVDFELRHKLQQRTRGAIDREKVYQAVLALDKKP